MLKQLLLDCTVVRSRVKGIVDGTCQGLWLLCSRFGDTGLLLRGVALDDGFAEVETWHSVCWAEQLLLGRGLIEYAGAIRR